MRRTVRARWLLPLLAALFVLTTGCGGGGDEAAAPPAPVDTSGGAAPGGATAPAAAPGGNTLGGSTVESNTGAEALRDSPFVLNDSQPVPRDFRVAYQQQNLIVVEFFKEGQDPLVPQGLEVDGYVSEDLAALRSTYPQVKFFSYEITNPGPADAEAPEDLDAGQYGTLAAQLQVGFTPFIVMLSPQPESEGDDYVIENLFQGYVERGVLDQALFDLTDVPVEEDVSTLNLALGGIELTEGGGGGLEYFTVTNGGQQPVDLQGFSLARVDPETGEVAEGSGTARIGAQLQVPPQGTVSIGRAANLVDGDGNRMGGVFESAGQLTLTPQDTVALLSPNGAVAATKLVQ